MSFLYLLPCSILYPLPFKDHLNLKSLNRMYTQRLSLVRLFATPWTVALQAPLSMWFPSQENWSGLPFPLLGIFLTQGSNLASLASPALAGRFFTTEPPFACSTHVLVEHQTQYSLHPALMSPRVCERDRRGDCSPVASYHILLMFPSSWHNFSL